MDKETERQLNALEAICRDLGAVVEHRPEYGHFTATICEDWSHPCDEAQALSIQKQIQRESAQYPGLVCYCLDPFSTLVYAV